MKPLIFIGCLVLFFACQEPSQETTTTTTTTETPSSKEEGGYDEALAQEYGADDYGMGQYVMAFLRRGPNRTQDSLQAAKLQAAHMANINRLAEEGKLLLAGPFLDDGDLRGIYIFDVKTIEEAEALTSTDPAIQAGSLVMELHPWYGSAGVRAIAPLHDKLAKVKM